ncbi:MAG: helix-turn-helix transcriptional regulator [Clostridia bacterium]|nr:helix-turn-helix transcriptional regulator [Clostridia bacterium]
MYLCCGFENYSTFYRAFLKYTGMSPEEFKKAQKSSSAKNQN